MFPAPVQMQQGHHVVAAAAQRLRVQVIIPPPPMPTSHPSPPSPSSFSIMPPGGLGKVQGLHIAAQIAGAAVTEASGINYNARDGATSKAQQWQSQKK